MKSDKTIKESFATPVKNAGHIFEIIIEVVLVVALIPVIKTFIATSENLTGTETLLLSLVTLFVVLGLIWNTIRILGLGQK
jgi:hypothetical protein